MHRLNPTLRPDISPQRRRDERLTVFTKYPVPGRSKTRLIPALGASGAADLGRRMTEHTILELAPLAREGIEVEVRFAGGDESRVRRWLGHGLRCRPQCGCDLGERMARALAEAFAEGARRAVIVGTDCPELDAAMVKRAFEETRGSDLVLGPAADGGYYLIGLGRESFARGGRALFEGVAWGTSEVLSATLRAAERVSLTVGLLGELCDVDRPGDLPRWERVLKSRLDELKSIPISVVIPALNEEPRIAAAVDRALAASGVEVIVADGGSSDDTRQRAEESGAFVISSRPGRAAQMNADVSPAKGDILLFLHADTLLPRGWDDELRRALTTPGVSGAAFAFALDLKDSAGAVVTRTTNWRSRTLGLPYGDQGLGVLRSVFRELGGYGPMPIMEDADLVRRLRRLGRVRTLDSAAVTSGRRWRAVGPVAASALNLFAIFAYFFGCPIPAIARTYRAASTWLGRSTVTTDGRTRSR